MKQIRRGTFETNSSSSHSLVVAPKAYTESYSYMKNESFRKKNPVQFI